MDFKTRYELIDYLKENICNADFINKHTRPQFAKMLRLLCVHETEQRPNKAFTSMCKKRQIKHIEFWLMLHGYM